MNRSARPLRGWALTGLAPVALLVLAGLLLLDRVPSRTANIPTEDAPSYRIEDSAAAGAPRVSVPAAALERLLRRIVRRIGHLDVTIEADSAALRLTLWTRLPVATGLGVPVILSYPASNAAPDRPSAVHIGRVPLPRVLANGVIAGLVHRTSRRLGITPGDAAAWSAALALSTAPPDLVVLHVDDEAGDAQALVRRTLRQLLIGVEGAGPYAAPLSATVAAAGTRFPALLAAAFGLARKDTLAGADPREANARVLRDLGVLALDSRAAVYQFPDRYLLNRREPWPRLSGRFDLGRHLLVSAGLVAAQGPQVARLAGDLKEVVDARGRSGFSLADLAANSIGIELAELALRDSNSALMIQGLMIAGVPETAFLASWARRPHDTTAGERRAGEADTAAVERGGGRTAFQVPGHGASSFGFESTPLLERLGVSGAVPNTARRVDQSSRSSDR